MPLTLDMDRTPCGKFSCTVRMLCDDFEKVLWESTKIGPTPMEPLIEIVVKIWDYHFPLYGEPAIYYHETLDQKIRSWGYKWAEQRVCFGKAGVRTINVPKQITTTVQTLH